MMYMLHTCQPIQFTGTKYSFLIILGGYGHIAKKMDTGKHNFHEILLF